MEADDERGEAGTLTVASPVMMLREVESLVMIVALLMPCEDLVIGEGLLVIVEVTGPIATMPASSVGIISP